MSRTDDLWNEVHVGLGSHPKTARARRRLGVGLPTMVGHIVLMWSWTTHYAPDGDLSRYDADVIADAAGWEDDPGVFVRAMVASGFLNDDLTVHDWDAYAGRLIDRRADNARRMRLAREARKARLNGAVSAHDAPDDDDTSGARAAHVQGLHNITGPDLTGPDITVPSPNPSPQAGRGDGPTGGATSVRNQRRRRGQEGESSAPPTPPEVLSPPSDADRAVWETARLLAKHDLTPANAALLDGFAVAGRGADGGLRLRAPPGQGLGRFRGLVARALADAGDDAGQHAVIV